MKYSVAMKFLAIILCAATLLGAVGAAAGLFTVAQLGGRTVEEAYSDALQDRAVVYAQYLGQEFASLEYGGAQRNMLNQRIGNDWESMFFNWSRVSYVLRDSDGNPVQEQEMPGDYEVEHRLTVPVFGQYMKVISVRPPETGTEDFAPMETIEPSVEPEQVEMIIRKGDYVAYDATGGQVAAVYQMVVTYVDPDSGDFASTGVSAVDTLGSIFHDQEGNARFQSSDPMELDIPMDALITKISFLDRQGNRLFEAECPSGVGRLTHGENGSLIFQGGIPGEEAQEETIPPETDSPAERMAGEEIMMDEPESIPEETGEPAAEAVPEVTAEPETEPEAVAAAFLEDRAAEFQETEPMGTEPAPVPVENIMTMTYYDSQLQREMLAEYVMEPFPEGYTLELGLASNAMNDAFEWTMLRIAYGVRNELVKWLGICVAVLAVCMVYLCCAAGRRRGTNAVCAGGMNRIPLDLYIGGGGLAMAGLVVAAVEGTAYLSRSTQEAGILYMAGMSFLIALLIVGIFFAFVAQIKTPGGYWWRNTLCARCAMLLWKFSKWFMAFCETSGKWLIPRFMGAFRGLLKVGMALWKWSRKAALWLWDTGKRLWCWAWDMVVRCWKWATKKLARFFGMLPITWQFLLTGFTLVFFLYICLRSYKVGWILMGFGIFFAAILYAASAFAILLENARRMSKGDLDTKVDDRMLIGGFKDFAGELNDLAGVAVLAAQKQLKSERMKTELITNVSHDIKTPLTSIINYVDLLQKPHSEQEQEAYLEVLSRQSLRLKKLIDDLMEMSKASTGNMTVEITRMDAAETVNQALGEFADKLERAELTPVFRQPEDTVEMLADGRLVWRIMSNLLSNTVKYALPGTRVYVDLLKADGKVIISLKNISREELNVNADELMERFVRGDASRNTEGSGLGLNIARSLMELQKGELQVLVDGDLFKVTMIFPGV